MSILIEQAKVFCQKAHNSIGQKRKYSNFDYWVHPFMVAQIVGEYTDKENVIIAAYLHDVLEDVNKNEFTLKTIKREFGSEVAILVVELTDVYTSEAFPELNRKERKELEANRLGGISIGAKIVKMADMLDNTADIVANDPGFAKKYLEEKQDILDRFHDSVMSCRDAKVLELYYKTLKSAITGFASINNDERGRNRFGG